MSVQHQCDKVIYHVLYVSYLILSLTLIFLKKSIKVLFLTSINRKKNLKTKSFCELCSLSRIILFFKRAQVVIKKYKTSITIFVCSLLLVETKSQ